MAVDWSGAKTRRAQTFGISVAVVRDCTSVETSIGRTREETIDYLIGCDPPVLVGFDFSFGFPAWFAHEHGCATSDEIWALAAREGESWLQPAPPFWRKRCEVPLELRYRRCEERLREAGFPAKSIFQLVGNGQVGAGSVRGMPLLARLRGEGFTIWPFEDTSDRTAFEIYPTRLRAEPLRGWNVGPFDSPHRRDAFISAIVLWNHRHEIATLRATTDPVTRIEGDVWQPARSL